MSKKPRKVEAPPAPDLKRPAEPSPLHSKIKTSFEYYESGGRHCLSESHGSHIKPFMDSLRKFTSMTWSQALAQGGKPGNKEGLAYTTYEDHALRSPRPANIPDDAKIAGIRASGRLRIFGIKVDNVFYVLWFDPDHAIVPG